MAALGAAEEPHFALISRPELAKPPERKIVLTLGALDLHGRLRFYFIVLIVHNGNLVFGALLLAGHMFGGFNLPDIPTLAAFKLATR
jgi:hypothetical protein